MWVRWCGFTVLRYVAQWSYYSQLEDGRSSEPTASSQSSPKLKRFAIGKVLSHVGEHPGVYEFALTTSVTSGKRLNRNC